MLNFFIASASAQDAAAAAPQAGGLTQFLPFVIIFFIFYFLMLRPQKKKLQEEQAMLSALGKGDEIYTKSGILGTIIGITEKIVTLESEGGAKFKILRSHIGGKAASLFEKKESDKK